MHSWQVHAHIHTWLTMEIVLVDVVVVVVVVVVIIGVGVCRWCCSSLAANVRVCSQPSICTIQWHTTLSVCVYAPRDARPWGVCRENGGRTVVLREGSNMTIIEFSSITFEQVEKWLYEFNTGFCECFWIQECGLSFVSNKAEIHAMYQVGWSIAGLYLSNANYFRIVYCGKNISMK